MPWLLLMAYKRSTCSEQGRSDPVDLTGLEPARVKGSGDDRRIANDLRVMIASIVGPHEKS